MLLRKNVGARMKKKMDCTKERISYFLYLNLLWICVYVNTNILNTLYMILTINVDAII